jgi:hypothetical protein
MRVEERIQFGEHRRIVSASGRDKRRALNLGQVVRCVKYLLHFFPLIGSHLNLGFGIWDLDFGLKSRFAFASCTDLLAAQFSV